MSRKENLIFEYFKLKHLFDTLQPEYYNVVTNEIPTPAEVSKFYKFTIYELENKIYDLNISIAEINKQAEVKKYYETKEGKLLKEELLKKRKELYNKHSNKIKSFEKYINDTLSIMLGDGWTCVAHFGQDNGNVEIGLVNTDKNRSGFIFEFGHTFTIYWDNYWNNKERLDLNYGTLGSFNLLESGTRQKYLSGLATVSNNTGWINDIKNMFKETYFELQKIKNEIDNIGEKLENPF